MMIFFFLLNMNMNFGFFKEVYYLVKKWLKNDLNKCIILYES